MWLFICHFQSNFFTNFSILAKWLQQQWFLTTYPHSLLVIIHFWSLILVPHLQYLSYFLLFLSQSIISNYWLVGKTVFELVFQSELAESLAGDISLHSRRHHVDAISDQVSGGWGGLRWCPPAPSPHGPAPRGYFCNHHPLWGQCSF